MCDEEQDLDWKPLTDKDAAWRETMQENARVICRIFSISPQELGSIVDRNSTKQECREALFHLIVSLSILPPP